MRAPPLSLRPMTGAPTFIAMSMTLQIFCAWRSRQRAAEHGEVLREDVDQAAVDRARAGDDAVARERLLLHAEVDAIVLDVHVIFFEAALIEQDAEPLAGGQPALGVLRRDALFAAAELGRVRGAFRALRWWLPCEPSLGRASFHGRSTGSILVRLRRGSSGSAQATRALAHVAAQHARDFVLMFVKVAEP